MRGDVACQIHDQNSLSVFGVFTSVSFGIGVVWIQKFIENSTCNFMQTANDFFGFSLRSR